MMGAPTRKRVFESEGHRLFILYRDLIVHERGSQVDMQWRNRAPTQQAAWRVLAHEFGRDYEAKKKPHIMVPKNCVTTHKIK